METLWYNFRLTELYAPVPGPALTPTHLKPKTAESCCTLANICDERVTHVDED
jgi:hypothetical protein